VVNDVTSNHAHEHITTVLDYRINTGGDALREIYFLLVFRIYI